MDEKDKIETYAMEYTCPNCGETVERMIPKGHEAIGYGGTCGYCGCKIGYGQGNPRKPYWLTQAEGMRNMAFSKGPAEQGR